MTTYDFGTSNSQKDYSTSLQSSESRKPQSVQIANGDNSLAFHYVLDRRVSPNCPELNHKIAQNCYISCPSPVPNNALPWGLR